MKLGRNDMCWCGSGKKYKTCHLALDDKLEDMKNRGFKIPTHAMIKNAEQIEGIREASKVMSGSPSVCNRKLRSHSCASRLVAKPRLHFCRFVPFQS